MFTILWQLGGGLPVLKGKPGAGLAMVVLSALFSNS